MNFTQTSVVDKIQSVLLSVPFFPSVNYSSNTLIYTYFKNIYLQIAVTVHTLSGFFKPKCPHTHTYIHQITSLSTS